MKRKIILNKITVECLFLANFVQFRFSRRYKLPRFRPISPVEASGEIIHYIKQPNYTLDPLDSSHRRETSIKVLLH